MKKSPRSKGLVESVIKNPKIEEKTRNKDGDISKIHMFHAKFKMSDGKFDKLNYQSERQTHLKSTKSSINLKQGSRGLSVQDFEEIKIQCT